MPSAPPEGVPAPADGALSRAALDAASGVPFGIYLHVPFCAARCGYCDFNTYTPAELRGVAELVGSGEPVVRAPGWAEAVRAELDLARRVLASADIQPASSIFVGGGTPTLLDPDVLASLIERAADGFGLAPGAEVTIEANPESVTVDRLARLRDAGVNRISIGMQSNAAHVLATLDRRHTPGRVAEAVTAARAAGITNVSLDLIYGTPGESDQDWVDTVRAALDLEPDHLSAYSLIVEPGTALAAAVRRGQIPAPDDDVAAARYEQVDALCAEAGLEWYEISNWSRPGYECRHNLGYWRSHSWWGLGPGAHSHVGGVRWWNVRRPEEYQQRLGAGESPAQAREVLTDQERVEEAVMLGIRLAEGLETSWVPPEAADEIGRLSADGLLVRHGDRLVLTDSGRLLADTVTRRLLV